MSEDKRYDGDFREVTEESAEETEFDKKEDSGSQSAEEGIADDGEDNGEDDGKDEKFCMICHRSAKKAGRLVEVPGGMCVCPDCLQKGFDSMQNAGFGINDSIGFFPPFITSDNIDLDMSGPMHQQKKKKPKKPAKKLTLADLPAPHKIKAKLDEYVIGQEKAKKIMAVGVYNHYKRILSAPSGEADVEIEKSNMLMIGPTGSGKTYLVKTLARLLDVPLAMTDATSLTEAGYIGDDIESVVSKLLAAADNDVERAEHGIIFIDEIDKIAKKKNTNQRDVSGEAVQQGMLKLLEGSEVEVPVGATNKNAMVPLETVNTKDILFICGGAFPDLENVIKERLTKASTMGFQSELKDRFDKEKNILQKVRMEDLRRFGMIPEFLGRLPVVFALDSLTEDMLVEILREPKNAILKQYKKLMEIDEVKLTFKDDALHAIAAEALKRETGARALRAIIEELMLDIMYEVPKDKNIGEVVITGDYVRHKGAPGIIFRGQE
jgi:ATP-dependent Clp protease ATP-binding subunit ClpX